MNKKEYAWLKVKESIMKIALENTEGTIVKLPSEMELSKKFEVSRATVREALAQLTQEGVIYKVNGKGSFIRTGLNHLNLDISKLYSINDAIKAISSSPSSKLLSKEFIRLDDEQSHRMGLTEGQNGLRIIKIKYASGIPAVYNINYFNPFFIEDISDSEANSSLFKCLENKGITVSYSRSKIKPAILTKQQLPEIENDFQLFLLLDEVYYNDEGQILGYTNDYYSSALFEFEILRRM